MDENSSLPFLFYKSGEIEYHNLTALRLLGQHCARYVRFAPYIDPSTRPELKGGGFYWGLLLEKGRPPRVATAPLGGTTDKHRPNLTLFLKIH